MAQTRLVAYRKATSSATADTTYTWQHTGVIGPQGATRTDFN